MIASLLRETSHAMSKDMAVSLWLCTKRSRVTRVKGQAADATSQRPQ
jgi:hypothetical protein